MLLNLDAGEHDSEPEALWALADVLAVACGGHAGDERSMAKLANFCVSHKIGLGAHPSYPDRANFGRVSLQIAPKDLMFAIEQQCMALELAASQAGATIGWVKPHGALYHDASRDRALADAFLLGVRAVFGTNVAIIGPPSGPLRDAALADFHYLREGFADRGTNPDGSLIPRGQPGALITDPALAVDRARELVGRVDTICIHADTPQALDIAQAVRKAIGDS